MQCNMQNAKPFSTTQQRMWKIVIVSGIDTLCDQARTHQRKQSFGRRRSSFFPFRSDESEPQDQSHSSAQAFLFITLLKRISVWCFIFCTSSIRFLLLFPFPHPPFFCPLSSRVVLFSAREGCRLHSGRTTCPPVHQTHPRRASGLDSKLKTHYRAISPV